MSLQGSESKEVLSSQHPSCRQHGPCLSYGNGEAIKLLEDTHVLYHKVIPNAVRKFYYLSEESCRSHEARYSSRGLDHEILTARPDVVYKAS